VNRRRELQEKTVWRSDPHTMVKHLVYRHYLACWMAKILQKFRAATIVDSFAGPGVYEDGPDGSPILIAKAYLEHNAYARFGSLHIVCQEYRADRVERLRRQILLLGDLPNLTVTVLPTGEFAIARDGGAGKLMITVREPGDFMTEQSALIQVATGGDPNRPVLWILDPFKINHLPFEQVAPCLAGRYHEAIITFFTDEMHRFCTRAGFDQTLDRHFGFTDWRPAVSVSGEGARKKAFVSAYRQRLETLDVLTEDFGVQVRNTTPRYSLIFATHSKYGLECWNPVKWKLDSYSGSGVSAEHLMQQDLFGSLLTPLEDALRTFAGTEQTWDTITDVATRNGFLPRQVREALDGLAAEGLAIRVSPVDARTPWPEGSIVRFYAPEDIEASEVDDPEDALDDS
jgi:three-Cys-motif partner protein